MYKFTNYMRENRNPGWIELFFDLSYAVLLGRLAHMLFHTHHGHFILEDLVSFMWIFMIQFMVWMLYTVYMNIYANDSMKQNLFGFALMSCLFIVAVLMQNVFKNANYLAFVMGVMSIIIALMYRKSINLVPENEKYARYKSRALIYLGVISMSMIFFTSTFAIATILIAYSLEHLIDEIFLNKVGMAKPDVEHFVERIGIFIILLMGESFITLFSNLPELNNLKDFIPSLLMLFVLFGMFVNYFSHNERMAQADYKRYSQILFYNYIVMIAFTILPVLVFHGVIQVLDLQIYKILVIAFVFLFYFGNGMAYRMSHERVIWQLVIYALVFPIIFAMILWSINTYMGVIIGLTIIVILTAILITYMNNHA